MRTETRTVNIGEDMGPVDWSYNFRQHFDSYCESDERRDERCAKVVALFRQADAFKGEPDVLVKIDGYWKPLLHVCMYDGWPWWRPVPHLRVHGVLGVEWHPFYSLQGVERK